MLSQVIMSLRYANPNKKGVFLMKEIEFTIKMTANDDFVDNATKWEHHAESLLDLDSYPEIKNVYDGHVTEIKNTTPERT